MYVHTHQDRCDTPHTNTEIGDIPAESSIKERVRSGRHNPRGCIPAPKCASHTRPIGPARAKLRSAGQMHRTVSTTRTSTTLRLRRPTRRPRQCGHLRDRADAGCRDRGHLRHRPDRDPGSPDRGHRCQSSPCLRRRDDAGRATQEMWLRTLTAAGGRPRALILPDGQDPASWLTTKETIDHSSLALEPVMTL